jgi:hypothetical protein
VGVVGVDLIHRADAAEVGGSGGEAVQQRLRRHQVGRNLNGNVGRQNLAGDRHYLYQPLWRKGFADFRL